ncbi:hypothetical protein [Bradyrhizobium sp. UFLA05-153]
MTSFKRGRDFAAWLAWSRDNIPQRERRVSDAFRGRIGGHSPVTHRWSMSRLNYLGRKSIPGESWLAQTLVRKPCMLVAIALPNKMAPTIWAMLTRKEDYQHPARA